MTVVTIFTSLFAAILFLLIRFKSKRQDQPVAVNYHFSRKCNKTCGFCFHTATTSDILKPQDAREGLALLKAAGMRKINFAGGEPFLYPKFLGEMVDYCKHSLKLESVSIVTNGSLVTRKFLAKHGHSIDIIAVSCDSFDEQTNIAIGRGDGDNVRKLREIAVWCEEHRIKFKINTVVCNLNWEENMNRHISELAPFRWKCFQVLLVQGENESEARLRDARKFSISDRQLEAFIERHEGQGKRMVPEPNRLMAKSYLILDEYMRFLDRDGHEPSPCILDVGVAQALRSVYWDKESFAARGGWYDWTSPKESPAVGQENLEW